MKIKTYKTEKSAKAKIKKEGLHLLNYDLVKQDDCRYSIHFYVQLLEDKHDLESRGFTAKVDLYKSND